MAFCNLDKTIYDGAGEYGVPRIAPYYGNVDIKYIDPQFL